MSTGWEPFNTAPKDGRSFLAAQDQDDDALPPRMAVCYISMTGDLCFDVVDFISGEGEFAPTHWMPLPEGPT